MGRPGPKRDLAAKERILQAAGGLVGERGPGRVGIDEIAAAAQVGKQTIYRWWPSKIAVLIDALELVFDAENPFPESGPTREALRSQMRSVATTFAAPQGAVIRELVASAQADDDVADQFRTRFFDQRRARARAAVERGIERGEIRAEVDVEAVVDALYAPLWLRLLLGHQPLDAAAADRALELVWPAIATGDAADGGLQ